MKENTTKRWEDLTLADNFIFQKFMRNEEMCKKILGEILNKKIEKVVYPEYEKTIDIRYDSKAIRLDLYVEGEDEIYNIEMQNISYAYLPQRGRYYQDLIDLDLLEKGKEYGELCQSYVIFICSFDFYELGEYRYTFTNRCHEVKDLEYGDLTTNGLFTRSMLNPMVPSRFLTPLFHQPINTVEHVFYILG